MQLAQWNPLREMEQLLTQMHRGNNRALTKADDNQALYWAPVVDIIENAKEYTVTAELPGVNKDDVKVDVRNGVLTLSGERRYESETGKDEKHHRIERFYGSFTRSFTVPEDVSADKINAQFTDGVLKVRLPKTEVGKPPATRIPVQ